MRTRRGGVPSHEHGDTLLGGPHHAFGGALKTFYWDGATLFYGDVDLPDWRRYLLEVGTGIDLHGEDETKAAQRAVKDAISHASMIGLREILKMKKELYAIIAQHSGKTIEQVEKDGDRDFWMTAQEALGYGMIDEVLDRTKDKTKK